MLNFNHYKQGDLSINFIGEQMRKEIKIEEFFMLPEWQLAYKALKIFNFKKLLPTEESVAIYAQKVLSANGILKNVDTPITYFVRIHLNLGSKLLLIKNQLESEAKKHLAVIEEVITHYHTLPFIIKYNKEPTTPRNNEERKYLTFYKRAQAKKEEIITYLLNGILHRAYEKAAPAISLQEDERFKDYSEQLEKFHDFPYMEFKFGITYEYHLNIDKLDYRRINPLINKMNWLENPQQIPNDYTDEINKGFESRMDTKLFFEEILKKLNYLPIISERGEIFEEMLFLLTEKRWYALFALSLPQVEGIFTEVLNMVEKKPGKGSLTEKVNTIRDYYEFAHYTFDYYEFTLADLRNSFSHTGKITQPKFQCYHLLMDIDYLLDVCLELDAPMSKVSKIISEGHTQFKHIGSFANFLNLLLVIQKENKYELIRPQAELYVYKTIFKRINIKKMISNLEKDFIQSISNFNKNLHLLMQQTGEKTEFLLFNSQINDIKPKLRVIETAFNSIPILVNEDLKVLLDTNTFLQNFTKFFPKTPRAIKTQIEKFNTDHQSVLKIVYFLTEQVKLEIPEDFLLFTRKLQHRL